MFRIRVGGLHFAMIGLSAALGGRDWNTDGHARLLTKTKMRINTYACTY